ncbi:MAG: hypothetical protein Q8936_04095 [Bacillota bacterium]|nr:hypothetical protein [Bacillota bacterium]
MKKLKAFFVFLLSLFMVLDIFALQISIFSHNKLLNENYYTARFSTLGLYSFINQSISSDLGNIQRECNLPQSIFDGIYNKTSIENKVNQYTVSILDYMKYKTHKFPLSDINDYSSAFNKNIDTFLATANVALDDSSKAEINNIKSQTANVMKNEVYLVNLNSFAGSQSFEKARSYAYKVYSAEGPLTGILVALIIVLLILERKDILSFFRWFSASLIAGGLMILIPCALLIHSGFMNNLALSAPKLQLIVGTIIRDFLQSMLTPSIYISIIGLVIFIAGMLLSNKKEIRA